MLVGFLCFVKLKGYKSEEPRRLKPYRLKN
jgi:hypothetical protein